ncbi:helix-turn-helix domain-containing protein [Brevibacillus panacihumi]|uniref:helix-turn-helix domain-containing protein n=1 Tax=Brevibacillus panacihumi TaxID=497735 RepID=UPI003D01C737
MKLDDNLVSFERANFYSIKELAEVIGIGKSTVANKIHDGIITGYEFQGITYFLKNRVNEIKKDLGVLEDFNRHEYVGVVKCAELLRVTNATVLKWMKSGKLRYVTHLQRKYAKRTDVNQLKNDRNIPDDWSREEFYSVKELAHELGVNSTTVRKWINKAIIEYTVHGSVMYIPKLHLEEIKKQCNVEETVNLDEYISIQELRKELTSINSEISTSTIHRCIRRGIIEKTVKYKGVLYIPKLSINKIISKYCLPDKKVPEDYMRIREVASLLSIKPQVINHLITKGKIEPLRVHIGEKVNLYVSKNSVERYLQNQHPKGYLTTSEAAIQLKTTQNTIQKRIKENVFPNVMKKGNHYYLTFEDIKAYEDTLIASKRPYTKNDAIDKLREIFDNLEIPLYLGKTKKLFEVYAIVKINQTNGKEARVYQKALELGRNFKKWVLVLKKEIFQLSEEEIETIINKNDLSEFCRSEFLRFLKYCYGALDIQPSREYFVTKHGRTDENDIYSPEIYHDYFTHVQNIEMHTLQATKDKYYCQMWLFTIMHLTDNWRASDIVINLPSIELELIGVTTIDWFVTNRLTLDQSQIIINYVYRKVRNLEASKTGALLTFLVQPDMIHTTATAMVISELHRRQSGEEFLLQSFIVGRGRMVRKPDSRHLSFFEGRPHLKEFRSTKMNRTTSTYLFYSITEDGNENTDIAIELVQQSRSHLHAETTAIYVQSTNKDGSINRVSINLFKRGHFGWLYNYIIMVALKRRGGSQSLEERTQAIQLLRKDFTPTELEGWASFMQRVQKKRESVISKLYKMQTNELITFVSKIFNGQMPAKTEHGQCLSFPNCAKPELSSCYSCENFIPQTYMLIEIVSEFKRLVKSISDQKYELIIKRDSEFLFNILLLVNEAIENYGEEFVNAFINLNEIQDSIESIAGRMLLK